MYTWVASWGSSEWAAFGAVAQALITLGAVLVALYQINDIRDQNRRWRTLEVCDKYHLEPHLVEGAKKLRHARDEGKDNFLEYVTQHWRALRPDAVTI